MAGARITVELDDRAALAALQRLQRMALGDVALMRVIGTALVEETLARFRSGTDPEGRAWTPLNPAYAAIKRGPGILRESRMLMRSITYVAGAAHVAVGSNRVYAAVHQFGGTIRPKAAKALVFRMGSNIVRARSVAIPARPYLGFGERDHVAVVEALEGMVQSALEG